MADSFDPESHIDFSKIVQTSSFDQINFKNFGARFFKRLFDIIVSLIGLLVLSPFFVYIAALIKRDTAGPFFYRGPRMGMNGIPFEILKFRTMYEDQRSYKGPSITAQGDERITPLGHWLRDTKINELPQLWNVLIGEMSLVGPRPEDEKIAKSWPREAAKVILSVRPGITSPASILYHDEENLLSGTNPLGDYFKTILPDKMRLDRLYVRHHSFFSDIDIIFWTLAILVPAIAKTRIHEGYIFAGPLTRLVQRYLSWFTLDLLAGLTAVAISSLLWRVNAPLNWGASHLAALGFLLAFLFSCINSILGVNRVIWSKAQPNDAVGLLSSCGLATTIILVLNYLQTFFHWLPYHPLAPMMVLTVGFLAGTGFLSVRYRLRLLTAIANIWLSWRKNQVDVGERMIIVGMDEGTQIASWLVQRRMFRTAFSVVGMVNHMDPTTHGMKVDGLWTLGSINDLPELLKKHDISAILSALPQNSPETEFVSSLSKDAPVRIILLKDLLWIVDQQVTRPVRKINSLPTLEEQLESRALQDTLTELPSYTLFQNRLRHSLALSKRNKTKTAFMLVELIGLHIAPDDLSRNSLLKEAANRINHTIREVDTLARFNDNTFALLFENLPDQPRLDLITKRISNVLSTPFKIKGQEIKIEVNFYISICTDCCEAAENPQNEDNKHCYECVWNHKIKKSNNNEVI